MTLLFLNSTKKIRFVQQHKDQPFKLGKASTRVCVSLKIQGNKKCGSCGGK